MSFKNILVPYDGSEPAKRAFAIARDLQSLDLGVRINVISVVEPPENNLIKNSDPYGFDASGQALGSPEFLDWRAKELERKNRELQHELEGLAGGPVTGLTAEAIPQTSYIETIVEAARDREADLIVMGSRGLGAIRSALGSVSAGVLRATKIPVLITK
jgi:nucleotide-binding universal stress UspA family protein